MEPQIEEEHDKVVVNKSIIKKCIIVIIIIVVIYFLYKLIKKICMHKEEIPLELTQLGFTPTSGNTITILSDYI